MSEALYYARGLQVHKRPVENRYDGGSRITMGFHVCTVSEHLGPEGAVTIAEMLDTADDGDRGTTRPPSNEGI